MAEEKKRAIEAAILPERGIWNGTAPLPGSEVHDLMTMPMLQAEQAPVVALTFDDGPSKYTAEILAILKKEQVPPPSSSWERTSKSVPPMPGWSPMPASRSAVTRWTTKT